MNGLYDPELDSGQLYSLCHQKEAVWLLHQSINQSVNGNITYLDEENEEKNIIVYLTITKNTIQKIMNRLLNHLSIFKTPFSTRWCR